MSISNTPMIATAITLALSLGCSGGQREANDTALGDDGTSGGDDSDDLEEVVDHGRAQYCVDRWVYNAAATASLSDDLSAEVVATHERWWSPATRGYVGVLDIADKPSPMVVPPMCGAADPLWGDAWDEAGQSCLVSGYHLQLPEVVSEPAPGAVQFPYNESIVYATIGNPPQSGRHTWMAEDCCRAVPTPDERAAWGEGPAGLGSEEIDAVGYDKNGDCRMHALFKGAQADAAGFNAPYDPLTRTHRTMAASMCVSNHGIYNPATLATYKVLGLGTWLKFHRTVKQHTTPINLNYDWVASWGLISYADFAGFGATIDAIVQALLAVLYLPPNGFEHPRYGGGSGCFYPAALKYTVSGWAARITCPYGYYAVFDDFDSGDLETQIDGVVGHCALDGIDHGSDGGDGIGPVILNPDSGVLHEYAVTDRDGLAALLDTTGDYANVEVAQAFDYDIEPGDKLAWWSSPGVAMSAGEDMRRTLEYDLLDLQLATGWSPDAVQQLADDYGPVELSELIDGLPVELQDRRAYTLRAGNTWTLRVERGPQVMFFYLH